MEPTLGEDNENNIMNNAAIEEAKPIHLSDLLPELCDLIYKCCSTKDLKNLSCCSSHFYEQVKESLWSNVSIPCSLLDGSEFQEKHGNKLLNLIYTRTLHLSDAYIGKQDTMSKFGDQELENSHYGRILNHLDPDIVHTFIRRGERPIHQQIFNTTLDKFPNLKHVTLSGKLLSKAIFRRVTLLHHIQTLNLSQTRVDNEIFLLICDRMPTLKSLNLSSTGVTTKHLLELQKLPSLSTLDLSWCEVGDIGASRLLECKTLTELDLSGCYLSDEGLKSLAKLKDLVRLRISHMKRERAQGGEYTGYTDAGVSYLLSLTKLEILTVDQNDQLISPLEQTEPVRLTSESISKLAGLHNLTGLCVGRAELNDQCVERLSVLQDLVHLDMSWCKGLSDKALEHLQSLTKLQTLLVAGEFTDAGLFHISKLPLLQNLAFQDYVDTRNRDAYYQFLPGITAAGLSHLKALTKLQALQLSAKLTDEGFQALSEITSLNALKLGKMALNKNAFKSLSRLPCLKFFECRDCELLEETPDEEEVEDISDHEFLEPEEIYVEDPPWDPWAPENQEDNINTENMYELMNEPPWAVDGKSHGESGPQNAEQSYQDRVLVEIPPVEDRQDHAQQAHEITLRSRYCRYHRVSRMPDNDCMVHIGNMSLLEQLAISNAAITEDCLPHLKRLENLEKLVIFDTGVTDEGLAELIIKHKVVEESVCGCLLV